MNYPPQSPSEPVVVCMGRALVAFDPQTGAPRWHYVADSAIVRLFRVASRVLALSGQLVVCVDLATGRLVGTVDVGFQPDAGLVCGTDLVLAEGTPPGTEAPRVACLSADGAIRWRATLEAKGAETVLRSYLASGQQNGEIRYVRSGYRAGILFGANVIQPDRD
ncbi:MAG: PQQ-binding-like beta-propeller repeat protein [Myxococcales bacterium]|jgi:outer membrane protein assembly factor BamB|nr:PQQ-binding-like beta-propeller repeat protein [Myxococcales bacterium]